MSPPRPRVCLICWAASVALQRQGGRRTPGLRWSLVQVNSFVDLILFIYFFATFGRHLNSPLSGKKLMPYVDSCFDHGCG